MKKKTNTKLEVKKLNKMKEQIVESLQSPLSRLIYDSQKTFSETKEKIKKIHEISKDPTFCKLIPTIEEIDEIHNIHDEHIKVLYECYKQYVVISVSKYSVFHMKGLKERITDIQNRERI